MNRTIFVLGAPRSGTTLLVNMLVINQSKIYGSTNESQFYTTTFRKPFTIDTYSTNGYFNTLLNKDEIATIYEKSENHLSFFKNAISYLLGRENKEVFVEKSPMHTLYYEELYHNFENVEFMIINRNACANVQSIAFTKWIPLSSDIFPSFIRNNKVVRYFFATLHYYSYVKVCKEVEKHPACKLSLNYEDIILEKINMAELLENALGFSPDELYVSRPFSDAVTHKNYGLDKSRVEDYKLKMPLYIQGFINLLFYPKNLFQKIFGRIIKVLIFEPPLLIKKIIGKK